MTYRKQGWFYNRRQKDRKRSKSLRSHEVKPQSDNPPPQHFPRGNTTSELDDCSVPSEQDIIEEDSSERDRIEQDACEKGREEEEQGEQERCEANDAGEGDFGETTLSNA